MVRRVVVKRFCGPTKFFPCFMVRKLKKFGKHWSSGTYDSGKKVAASVK